MSRCAIWHSWRRLGEEWRARLVKADPNRGDGKLIVCGNVMLATTQRVGSLMPMTGAERQRRYRERHSLDLAHITLDVRVAVRDQLDRLAWHYSCGVTELVEKLAEAAERHIEATLSGKALEAYRAAGYEGEQFVSDLCAARAFLASSSGIMMNSASVGSGSLPLPCGPDGFSQMCPVERPRRLLRCRRMDTAAGITSDASEELDRLRAENAELRARLLASTGLLQITHKTLELLAEEIRANREILGLRP
jgi:hypothetical protein